MDAAIRGHQDAGVQSVAKHYIGNEQETQRTNVVTNGINTEAVSSNIDDRTLHELYLWPFANSIKAGTASVMCSYQRLNLTYACENDDALNKILKKELGFPGYVMSDWFGTHSGVKSIEAGLDMTMPGVTEQALASLTLSIPYDQVPSYFGGNLTAAVNNGTIQESRVDDMVHRIMTPYYHLSQDAEGYPSVDPSTSYIFNIINGFPVNTSSIPPARDVRGDHGALVRDIAAAGTVLLKNDGDILPIRNVANVAVFGNGAPDTTDGLYFGQSFVNTDRPLGAEYGALSIGSGSGAGRTSDLVSPLRAIRERGFRDGYRTQYISNNDLIAAGNSTTIIFPIPDICIVFLKTMATENWDRLSFENDWNSTLVVQNVVDLCGNKTVVITNSAGINTLPWNDNATAIVAAHYPGEQNGNSIVDILWGNVNPSGHLTYTIPKQESDYDIPVVNITGPEALDSNKWQSNFTEGLLIDYRHFDSHGIEPLYEFGYGLSYTTFDLSPSIKIDQIVRNLTSLPISSSAPTPGGNPDLWSTVLNVTAIVSNTGFVAGAAVPQLYVSLPSDSPGSAPSGTPVRVLRGFEKVQLSPNQSATVTFPLMRRDVSFWSVEDQDWRIPQGSIGLSLGFSSRDFRAATDVKLL
jgi:beta-glucosidase